MRKAARAVIRDYREGDYADLVANIDPRDAREVIATTGASMEESVARAIETGNIKVGCADEDMLCIFGVASSLLLPDIGTPWLLRTTRVKDHRSLFLRACRRQFEEWTRNYTELENYVDARNEDTVLWLQFVGFKIHETVPYGALSRPFRRFSWSAT